ncbi:MAG: adenosine-specific kinase [Thaumarchaeota archaeon]|nr:adenosine-specific kinase [Candidatus Calditenuaceae archaeon]MDW8187434.1 adenosine-specific kinase [Nitrososphaerota archaeon]
MQLHVVKVEFPEGVQLILAQSHFIKTVEDVHEALVTSFSGIKFGIAFCESSGKRLVRHSGTDEELERVAVENALRLGCGHLLVILLRNAYPINVLQRLREVQEIVGFYCATGNPVQVIVAETEQGRGVLGVIDGQTPLGVEGPEEIKERKEFLRKIGYKL